MKAIDKLKELTKSLKTFGLEIPEKEAEILIRHGLKIDTVELYKDKHELSEWQIKTVENILNRRRMREPLQYILGYEEFLGLKILVGPGVLIPRPETELLAEQAIKAVNSKQSTVNSKKILDVGTGSGCIALAIAKEFPDSEVYGTDILETAIEYANKNAELNCIDNITFLKGNLFEPIKKLLTSHFSPLTFDLIISNPPYIKTNDIRTLQPEIKDWEPLIAIDGGTNGLNFYKELIPNARDFLKDDGLLILELGYGQSSEVTEMLTSSGYTQIETIKDYSGIERIIKAR